MNDKASPERLSKAERYFNDFSKWIGLALFCAAMYFNLALGQDVHWIIYGVGGALMGADKALNVWKAGKGS